MAEQASSSTSAVVPKVDPYVEVGASGLKRAGGFVSEEYVPQLRGAAFYRVIDEMLNEPLINGVMLAIDSLIRQVQWSVVAGGNTPADEEAKQFLEECMSDMSHTWADLISEVLTMLPYGFAPMELVYKKRNGESKDGSSKYEDGRIGWRKIVLRSQDTVSEWKWDENGGLQGFVQQDPQSPKPVTISIEKTLLFRAVTRKQNPEGRSILRSAYRPYYFKKRMEEIEAIGIERDLAGFPQLRIPAELMASDASPALKAVYEEYKKLIRNVRRDEQEGIVLPSSRDQSGNLLYEFSLVSSGGARTFDTGGIISRYQKGIAMSMLADFILLGHEGVGSFALSSDKTNLFSTALGSVLQAVKEVFNTYGVQRLFKLNQFKLDKLPELTYEDIETPSLGELGAFLTALVGAGVPLFPNDELQEYLMSVANLPYSKGESPVAEAAPEPEDEKVPEDTAEKPQPEDEEGPAVQPGSGKGKSDAK